MDNSFNNKDGRIILNGDKQVQRPALLDAYGVEIDPREELYIPCLDGTHRGEYRDTKRRKKTLDALKENEE